MKEKPPFWSDYTKPVDDAEILKALRGIGSGGRKRRREARAALAADLCDNAEHRALRPVTDDAVADSQPPVADARRPKR